MIRFKHRGYNVTIERSAYPEYPFESDSPYYSMRVTLHHKQLTMPFTSAYMVSEPFYNEIERRKDLQYYKLNEALRMMKESLKDEYIKGFEADITHKFK